MTAIQRVISAAFVALTLSAGSVARAADVCSAILNHGIMDEHLVLDSGASYTLAKSLLCTSSTTSGKTDANGTYGSVTGSWNQSKSDAEKFCNSTYDEANNDSSLTVFSKKINEQVVREWGRCVAQLQVGVIHSITPSTDPQTFTYTVKYKNDGKPYTVKLDQWSVSPETVWCTGGPPRKGLVINSGGKEFLCHRLDPLKPVEIVLNIVGSTGKSGLKPIELPGITPPRVVLPGTDQPTHEPLTIVDKLASGAQCFVEFQLADPEGAKQRGCVPTPGATLARWAPYKIKYTGNDTDGSWQVIGPVCSQSSSQEVDKKGKNPRLGTVNAWGALFSITLDGMVTSQANPRVTGYVTCP